MALSRQQTDPEVRKGVLKTDLPPPAENVCLIQSEEQHEQVEIDENRANDKSIGYLS